VGNGKWEDTIQLMKWCMGNILHTINAQKLVCHAAYLHDSFLHRTARWKRPIPAVKAPANQRSWRRNLTEHHSQTAHVWVLVHRRSLVQCEHVFPTSWNTQNSNSKQICEPDRPAVVTVIATGITLWPLSGTSSFVKWHSAVHGFFVYTGDYS